MPEKPRSDPRGTLPGMAASIRDKPEVKDPAPARYYSVTLVAEHDQELAATLLSIPHRPGGPKEPAMIARFLGIEIRTVWNGLLGSNLPKLLSPLLLSALTVPTEPTDDDRDFIEQVCYRPFIPVEASPISGQALATLVTQGSGSGTGAVVGLLATGGEPSPLLLLTVPAGVVIAGAAVGISRGLASGLEVRIYRWLAGPQALLPEVADPPDED